MDDGLDSAVMSSRASGTLKQKMLRAGGWTVLGFGAGQMVRVISSLVMTRLLVPEMFGVMAIATMVTVILTMLSDIGLQQNIVRSHRGDDPLFLDTAWAVQIARGVLLWAIALLISAALYLANAVELFPKKSVYASPELPWVIVVSSFTAVILGFQSTRASTAHRNFDQRRLVQIEVVSRVLGLVVMAAVGFMTRSIWALVLGGLVGSLVTTVLSHGWLAGHRNQLRWERGAIQELLTFGKWIFISSAVSVLAMNGDRLLLGLFVDAGVLGLYSIAALIVGVIEGALSKLLFTVSLPALSEIARDSPSRLRGVYYRFRVPADLALLFLCGIVFTAGDLVIDLLYDSRYQGAGPILQVLGLSLFAVRYAPAHQVYLAVGTPFYLAVINTVRFVTLWAFVPALYYWGGTQAAIWGIALHAVATVPFIYYFNGKLGLNDYRLELRVLIALPMGVLFGELINLMYR